MDSELENIKAEDSTDYEDGSKQRNQFADLDTIDILVKTVFYNYSKHHDGAVPFNVVREHLL